MESKYFTEKEVIYSPTAEKFKINNSPSKQQWINIQSLITNVLDVVREGLDSPIKVNSIFRSQKLNERVKGAGTSQHLANKGAAADIECEKLGNKKLFNYIKDNIEFDQLIWEYGSKIDGPDWVHVSYVSEKENRKQILQCIKDSNGNPKYISYK